MRSSFGLLAIIFVLSAATMAVASEPTAFKRISWNPQQIETGSPCLFRVEMEDPLSALNGTWMGHTIRFFTAGEPHVWYGLAGVDVEVRPGTYELELSATLPDGNVIHTTRTLQVRSGKYKTVTLHVPDRFVEPDAETLRRIESDKEIKKNAFSHQTAGPEWSGSFRPPLQSTVTEVFGTRERSMENWPVFTVAWTIVLRPGRLSSPPIPAKLCWLAICSTKAIASSSITVSSS